MNRDINATNLNDQLDRLVSGDLDEREREPLIAWLDEDPRRWRLCGLLFLESQSWSDALAEWPCTDRLAAAPSKPLDMNTHATRRRQIMHGAILAASVLLSFLLGFAIRGLNEPNRFIANEPLAAPGKASPTNISPVMAELPVQSTLRGLPKSTVQIPLVADSSSHHAHEPVSDYVRQQFERRGYQLQLERRYLFARLPSGQQVAVPVDQYSVKRVPPQIN
jgi:hypothetical protein